MRRSARGGPAAAPSWIVLVVAGLVFAIPAAVGCTRAAADGGAPGTDEQRLLPAIIRQQEARVAEAEKAGAATRDQSTALRLRQRILEQYGRADLALALEREATRREAELQIHEQRLADAQVALAAYRDYAARANAAIDVQPTARHPAQTVPGHPAGSAGARHRTTP